MNHSATKRYQIALWSTPNRGDSSVAMRFEFDALAPARAEFEAQRAAGHYVEGLLFEWLKDSDDWELIDRFPRP
jgi:hypothetical protein